MESAATPGIAGAVAPSSIVSGHVRGPEMPARLRHRRWFLARLQKGQELESRALCDTE